MTVPLDYTYHLFLQHQVTKESIVQTIIVTAHVGEVMDANLLFQKLSANTQQFDKGYVLIGLTIGEVVKTDPTK